MFCQKKFLPFSVGENIESGWKKCCNFQGEMRFLTQKI
jgi:hypothetical protein